VARIIKPLTDIQVRTAKPKEKSYKLFDGGGLFLLINTNGKKWWRLKYLINKKENLISIGTYPNVSLREARLKRDEYKNMVASGVNPSIFKKQTQPIGQTVEQTAKEWFEQNKHVWSGGHIKNISKYIERRIIPQLGNLPIADIKAADIISFGKKIEIEGYLETLHKTLIVLGQIFRYASSVGYTSHNIMSAIDKKSAFKQHQNKNYPVITDSQGLRDLLLSIDNYHGSVITNYALKIAINVFLRPGEIRYAEWRDIDFDKKIWRIPAEKMKMKSIHIVPLSRQVIELLRTLNNLTGKYRYLFTSQTTTLKPISENTMLHALRRLGYSKGELVVHSFRGIASTILHENISVHGIHSDAIERQLAHQEHNKVKSAYNHAEYIPERTQLMQWWSDYLDDIKGI